MFFNEDRNFALFNNQSLDTYHEIVISFDYCRYNRKSVPTGGFSLCFFRSNFERPKGGGPDQALGYLPSTKTDYCKLKGFPGLNGAVFGIGFDTNGGFAKKTPQYDGVELPTNNAITLRYGLEDNFKYIDSSKNLKNTSLSLQLADFYQHNEEPEFKTVRVIISNGFTKIKVEMKSEKEKFFTTVMDVKVPIKLRDAVKVALISTVSDNDTEFDVKNFNVMGFPGTPRPDQFDACLQTDPLGGYVRGSYIVSGDKFVAIPSVGSIYVYKVLNKKFVVDQVLSESSDLVLLGGNNKFLFGSVKDTTEISIYYNNNGKFFKSQTLDLKFNVPVTELPDEQPIYDTPLCADTDSKTLAIGTGRYVVLYNYFGNISDGSSFGSFIYFQTLWDELTGGLGISVAVEDNKLLAGSSKGFVNFYQDDGIVYKHNQSIFTPATGNPYAKFGHAIDLQGNDLIIGAPHEFKNRYTTVGQGEVYHYYYSRDRQSGIREWKKIMNIGNYFFVDSPGANFGESLQLKGNNLIVGAPGENYLAPGFQFENVPNLGRIYIFRKSPLGLFTQGVILSPGDERAVPYTFFGRFVGLYDTYVGVGIAQYTQSARKSDVSFFNIDCAFPEPPAHVRVGPDSIALVDNGGYVIDIDTLTYMQLLCSASTYNVPESIEGGSGSFG